MENRPGGCKSTEEYAAHYVHHKIMECMNEYKSKEETVKHLCDQFQITHQMTNIVWDHLEQTYPEEFRSYYKICNNNRKIRGPKVTTPAQTTAETISCSTIPMHFLIPRLFRDKSGKEQEQQRRFMETAQNMQRDANGSLIPGGATSVEEFSYYVHGRIMECMRNYKSKEETVKHLLDQFQIAPESTNTVWDRLEQAYPGNFRSYYEACEDNRKIRKHDAPNETAPAQIQAEIQSEPQEDATSKSVEEFEKYVKGRILECIRDYSRSKEEIVKDLLDQYRITLNTAWDDLERVDPVFFSLHHTMSDTKGQAENQQLPQDD